MLILNVQIDSERLVDFFAHFKDNKNSSFVIVISKNKL